MIQWKTIYDRKSAELRESKSQSNLISFSFDDMMEIYGPQIAEKVEE
jgi:hypothetical protein